MRTLPKLMLLLGGVAGVALGLSVMWGAGGGGSVGAGGPGATTSAGVPQGHVYTGAGDEPDDVNPLTTSLPVARRLVLFYTHETLLEVDPASGELVPALAASFERSADDMACTFTLRAGVQFADGSPLTLDDVLFGWQLHQAGHLPMGTIAGAFTRLREVERLDDHRFRVHFKEPHYAGLRVVGESWYVASRKFFMDRIAARCRPAPPPAIDSREFATLLDQIDRECGPGTGPYLLENDPDGVQRWRPRQDLVLVRNPHCWRRRVHPGTWNFDGFRILWRDQGAARHALLRGELDWFITFDLESLLAARPQLADQYDTRHYDYEALGVYRVIWNCRRLADPRVRQALGMLFDCDGILRQFPDAGARAVAHCKPRSAAVPPELVPLPFDPGRARALLREAGFDPAAGTPLSLRVIANQGTDVLARIADLFQDAAATAGVRLELLRRDAGAARAEQQKGEWDGWLVLQSFKAWGDPFDLLHSAGQENHGKWQNADADRLAAAARTELDPGKRDGLWRELHTIAFGEQPAALLLHPQVALLLDRRIEDESIGRNGLVLERAFVAPDRQRR
ncbi:MAG: ABC transporter substrate-binding protein [Planctomycetota bacterium]